MNNKKVLNDLRKLDSLQVNYLDCDSYNQKQGNEYFENLPINKDLKAIYNSLWNNLIIKFIDDNNLDLDKSDLSVNFIGKDENGFYIQWYEPETITYIKDILNGKKYNAFKDYKKD